MKETRPLRVDCIARYVFGGRVRRMYWSENSLHIARLRALKERREGLMRWALVGFEWRDVPEVCDG